MVSNVSPPLVAAIKRSEVSQPATSPTEHGSALSAYRAGDLREWAVHKLDAAGRADEVKSNSAKRAKTDNSVPMTAVITGDAAVSIHIPKLAKGKALFTEILKYASMRFKSGASRSFNLQKLNLCLASCCHMASCTHGCL